MKISQLSSLGLRTPETIKQYIGLIILKAQVSAYANVFIAVSIVLLIAAATSLNIKLKNKETGKLEIDDPSLMEI